MIGTAIGAGIGGLRDAIARGLVRIGVGPNALTVMGLLFTLAAGACLALGAGAGAAWTLRAGALSAYEPNAWATLAGVMLLLCCAGDMLDGAVARVGRKGTTFGAFLDSTLDRVSDFAIYLGIGFYFLCRGNLTNALLPFVAVFVAQMVSYTRARAEDLIDFKPVGFWQRGERTVAIIIAAFAHNVPTLLWQQALGPLLTVWARIDYTRRAAAGQTPCVDPRASKRRLDRLRLWRYPRRTLPHDLVCAVHIAILLFVRIPPAADPVGQLLGLR